MIRTLEEIREILIAAGEAVSDDRISWLDSDHVVVQYALRQSRHHDRITGYSMGDVYRLDGEDIEYVGLYYPRHY